jgi:hypothetical protein
MGLQILRDGPAYISATTTSISLQPLHHLNFYHRYITTVYNRYTCNEHFIIIVIIPMKDRMIVLDRANYDKRVSKNSWKLYNSTYVGFHN